MQQASSTSTPPLTPSAADDVLDDERMRPVPWMHGAAGVMGGALSMTIFYPLDLIRTRLHVQNGDPRMALRDVRVMVHEQGFRCLFQGVKIAVLAHSVGWGTYLTLFRTVQHALQREFGTGTLSDAVAACTAAVSTAMLVTPLNVLKTRSQLHEAEKGAKKRISARRQFFGILKHEGVFGLFRGAGPQILLSLNTTIHVCLYETIRRYLWGETAPPVYGVAAASACSKAVASVLCNPLEVCRTRLQDRRNVNDPGYASMGTAFRTIWRKEGLKGLYRGVFVNACRVVPTTVVAFIAYEQLLSSIHYQATGHWRA